MSDNEPWLPPGHAERLTVGARVIVRPSPECRETWHSGDDGLIGTIMTTTMVEPGITEPDFGIGRVRVATPVAGLDGPWVKGDVVVTAPAAAPEGSGAGGQLLSPLVRRLIEENGLDATAIPGTGVGGRITREDVLGVLDARAGGAPAAPTDVDIQQHRRTHETKCRQREPERDHCA